MPVACPVLCAAPHVIVKLLPLELIHNSAHLRHPRPNTIMEVCRAQTGRQHAARSAELEAVTCSRCLYLGRRSQSGCKSMAAKQTRAGYCRAPGQLHAPPFNRDGSGANSHGSRAYVLQMHALDCESHSRRAVSWTESGPSSLSGRMRSGLSESRSQELQKVRCVAGESCRREINVLRVCSTAQHGRPAEGAGACLCMRLRSGPAGCPAAVTPRHA